MILSLFLLTSCSGEKKFAFSVGQCVMAVDGNQVWKILEIKGQNVQAHLTKSTENQNTENQKQPLNLQRRYVAVDCP